MVTGRSAFPAAAALAALLLLPRPARGQVDLVVEGNDEVPRRRIESALDLPERPLEMDAADWEVWSEDAAGLLSDLYGETGHFDAAFRFLPGDSAAGKGAPFRIKVLVREGARYRFGRVAVDAAGGAAPEHDPDDLKCRPGREFDQALVFRDRRVLLNSFGDAGFLHAKAAETLIPDTSAKTVDLVFRVDPGPAVVFDTLLIRNLREGDTTGAPGVTRAPLLRDLAGLERGDTLSQEWLGTLERKLRSTRAFNYVRLKDSLLANGRSALLLATEERVPGEMDFSVFYETQYGFGAGFDWSHANMFGLLHEGRLGGSLAQRRQHAYLGYASALFFGSSFRFDNDLLATWYQDSRLQEDEAPYRGDFEIANISRISRAVTSWSRYVGTTELRGESYETAPGDRIRDFTLNFINSAFFNFLDNVVNPVRGLRWAFTWGNGGRVFEDVDLGMPTSGRHNWLEGESALFLPLHKRLNLALRLDGGRFYGDGGINSDRFFLGGPRSVRSFGWRELCPDKDGITGICRQEGLEPAYFLASVEARTSPFTPAIIDPEGRLRHLLGVQVVPFVDYGNVWEVGKALTESGEGRAYGLGIRYSLLSVFNLRVDFATDGPEFRNWQWVLDLAQAF